MAGFHIERFI